MSDKSNNHTFSHKIATVYILDLPYHVDRPFDYIIPDGITANAGDFAAVPFGGGNRPQTALIVSVTGLEVQTDKLKPIHSLLDKAYSLNSEQLALTEFLRSYTLCTTGDAVRTVTPAAAFSRLDEYIILKSQLPDTYSFTSPERELFSYVEQNRATTKKEISEKFGKRGLRLISELTDGGYLEIELRVKDNFNIKYSTLYTVSENITETEINKLRSEAHKKIVTYLREAPHTEQADIISALGVSVAQLKALQKRGYINAELKEAYRIPYSSASKKCTDIKLSAHQQQAADKIIALTRVGEPKAVLLHGITGSGKTQVIRAVMDEVISAGKSVIVLVPEIALTPQTISVFSACYGERTAVLHSGLSTGERFDAWRRIQRGEVDVCIGTRSAVFAPFEKIGLIVIDEEQEHTYKSDSSPKYNARDIARFRCAKHNAVMLLASATPSLESYYKAKRGTYSLVELTERFGTAKLPDTENIDMRNETKDGNFSLFSQELLSAIWQNLSSGKQSILLLNRRGYHSFVNCPSCGAAITCPHCSVSLTHHHSRFDPKGFLSCHYCGFRAEVPEKCPSCGFGKLRFMGYGTQLAEEQLSKLFPSARILRMDADTTSGKFSYDEILGNFRRGEADILLGTQMVAKGHDFPNVTLVGILSAEQSLYLDDYRANERTFSMICQTVGRAGRADASGKALIQCYSPDNRILQLASKQDYKAFFDGEIKLRSSLNFPPFCDIAAFTITADDERNVFSAATALFNKLKDLTTERLKNEFFTMFGPFEAPIYKLNEKYRARIVVKFKNSRMARSVFRDALIYFGESFPQSIIASVDINPTSI